MPNRHTVTYQDKFKIKVNWYELADLSRLVNDVQGELLRRSEENAITGLHSGALVQELAVFYLAGHMSLGPLKTDLLVKLTKRRLVTQNMQTEFELSLPSGPAVVLMHWYLYHFHAHSDELRRVMSKIDRKLQDIFFLTYDQLKR